MVVALLVVAFLILTNQPTPTTGIIPPTVTSPVALADGKTLGSRGAPVTLDLWADFQCPGCHQFTLAAEPQLVTTYVATGKARLVFHDFVFIGPESTAAAVAASCADRQGKFWPYHDYLFANQGRENSGAFSQARLREIATDAGLDQAAYATCTADPAVAAAVQQELQQGMAAGVNVTPTIFVNGKRVSSNDAATVSAAIDAALGSATPGPLPSAAPSASISPSA